MSLETFNGSCSYIEVDAEEQTTTATFIFRTPNSTAMFSAFMTSLATGVELIVESDDD